MKNPTQEELLNLVLKSFDLVAEAVNLAVTQNEVRQQATHYRKSEAGEYAMGNNYHPYTLEELQAYVAQGLQGRASQEVILWVAELLHKIQVLTEDRQILRAAMEHGGS